MTYLLTSEDRRKLEEALRHAEKFVMFATPQIERHGNQAADPTLLTIDAALSLLAGLPKVQDDRGQHSMDPLRLREVQANAKRYLWLRDVSVPPHNFYISVPEEFNGVRYSESQVDAYIDAAMKEHP